MAKGWVSIHRKILDNWIWEEDTFSRGQAWIDLILLANHEEKKVMFDGNLIVVEKGSRITSLRKLSERWKWSTTKTKKFLDVLQSDGMITYKSDSKKTTYTICNYNTYQNEYLEKRNTEITQEEHRDNTEITQKKTNNNENNDNNENNENNAAGVFTPIISSWNDIGGNVSKVKAINPGTSRYRLLKARINTYGEDAIIKAIDNVKSSPFLKGESNSGWIISFDWFIRPDNFIKVYEGNYNDDKTNKVNVKNNFINSSDLQYMKLDTLDNDEEFW